MPSINAGDLATCLLRKLQASESGGRHRTFEIYDDDGRLVARTWMSHGWKGNTPISAKLIGIVGKQLHLTKSADLAGLVSCTLTREQYLELIS
jgi:hypothetical protein